METKLLYEYAIIRVVPRVEREEFLNIGAIVFCKQLKSIRCAFHLDPVRLMQCFAELDLEELVRHTHSFLQISEGDIEGGPIAQLDAPSRFRWLTATRSTILQTSKVHPGMCSNEGEILAALMSAFVF